MNDGRGHASEEEVGGTECKMVISTSSGDGVDGKFVVVHSWGFLNFAWINWRGVEERQESHKWITWRTVVLPIEWRALEFEESRHSSPQTTWKDITRKVSLNFRVGGRMVLGYRFWGERTFSKLSPHNRRYLCKWRLVLLLVGDSLKFTIHLLAQCHVALFHYPNWLRNSK